jgi:hypothetical protein
MEKYEELSLNIRSAFRLLAYYNQRILSLMNHISEKLSLPPVCDNSPYELVKNNKNNLKNGSDTLSWLPMFFHEFHFESRDIRFSVIIQSDSAGWIEDIDWAEIDKFTDLNSSKTRFLFAITNSPNWDVDDIYPEENFDDFLKSEYVITKNKKTIVCKSFELIDFKDEDTTNNTLSNYVEYVKTKGINNIEYH